MVPRTLSTSPRTARTSCHQDGAPNDSIRYIAITGWLIIAMFFGGIGTWAGTAPLNGAVVANAIVSIDDAPVDAVAGGRPVWRVRRRLEPARLSDGRSVDWSSGPAIAVAGTAEPRRFFRDLASLVLEEDYHVRHLETLDGSAQAILGYLLGAGR